MKNKSKKETVPLNPFVIKKIEVLEIPNDTGETDETTIIKINFDGILLHLSVPASMRLQRKLSEILDN